MARRSDGLVQPGSFFRWRAVWMQYSGVLGIGVMSLAMLLAIRPVVLEPHLGGLDKMYRLHKWLGIAGLTLSVSHWLMAQVPKWLVGWGLLGTPGAPVAARLVVRLGRAISHKPAPSGRKYRRMGVLRRAGADGASPGRGTFRIAGSSKPIVCWP